MRKNRTDTPKQQFGKSKTIFKRKIWRALLIIFVAIFIISAANIILTYYQTANESRELKQLASSISAGEEWEQIVLEQYNKLHERNTDMIGWIRINGTEINYPVMYTADDFYLTHDFNKKNAKNGLPYIDKRCSAEPFGTNTIIYGHHMKNGTMFTGLDNYKNEEFYIMHPTIRFDTLHKLQKYEIIAVFEGEVYRKNDNVYKYYNFLNAENETDFNEYINNIKAMALYDTGISASYGDELITLITCSYHTKNGRLVVVAKKI